MSVSSVTNGRVDLSGRTGLLALGDLAAILLFVTLGEIQHGFSPVGQFGRLLGTLTPFLIGWIVVALVSRQYTQAVQASVRSAVLRTAATWIPAVVVAQVLRGTAIFHGDASIAFGAVSVVVGGAFLCLWRSLAAFGL